MRRWCPRGIASARNFPGDPGMPAPEVHRTAEEFCTNSQFLRGRMLVRAARRGVHSRTAEEQQRNYKALPQRKKREDRRGVCQRMESGMMPTTAVVLSKRNARAKDLHLLAGPTDKGSSGSRRRKRINTDLLRDGAGLRTRTLAPRPHRHFSLLLPGWYRAPVIGPRRDPAVVHSIRRDPHTLRLWGQPTDAGPSLRFARGQALRSGRQGAVLCVPLRSSASPAVSQCLLLCVSRCSSPSSSTLE
jgi:hypothetical protein